MTVGSEVVRRLAEDVAGRLAEADGSDVRRHQTNGDQVVREALAAKLLNDALDSLPLDLAGAPRWPTTPSAEEDVLESERWSLQRAHARLASAVDRGAISPLSATVVWRTRVQVEDEMDVATDLGVSLRTMQRRRQRAERQLAAAS